MLREKGLQVGQPDPGGQVISSGRRQQPHDEREQGIAAVMPCKKKKYNARFPPVSIN